MNPVVLELADFRDDRIPSPSSQEWIFTQTLTAAPSGPHVSGTVIQASDRTSRSSHWFSAGFVTTPLLIFEKWNQIDSNIRFLYGCLRLDSSMQGLFVPFACIGSGDPVRVLRLYTTNTLDTLWSIYCWDICTTCRYRSYVLLYLLIPLACANPWAWLTLALYCAVSYIAACVDVSRTVFRDRSSTHFAITSWASLWQNIKHNIVFRSLLQSDCTNLIGMSHRNNFINPLTPWHLTHTQNSPYTHP